MEGSREETNYRLAFTEALAEGIDKQEAFVCIARMNNLQCFVKTELINSESVHKDGGQGDTIGKELLVARLEEVIDYKSYL